MTNEEEIQKLKKAWLWADAELNKYASLMMKLETALETIANEYPSHESGTLAKEAIAKFREDMEKPNMVEVSRETSAPEGGQN